MSTSDSSGNNSSNNAGNIEIDPANQSKLANDAANGQDAAATIQFDKEVDATGLKCPLPILRAKKALSDMESGQVLKVISTDPGSVRDFQAFAKQTGNQLVSQVQYGESWIHALRRR